MRSNHIMQCPLSRYYSQPVSCRQYTHPSAPLVPVPFSTLPFYHIGSTVPKLHSSTVPKFHSLHVCIRSPSHLLQLPPQHNPLRRNSETRNSNQNTITLHNRKHHNTILNLPLGRHRPPEIEGGGKLSVIDRQAGRQARQGKAGEAGNAGGAGRARQGRARQARQGRARQAGKVGRQDRAGRQGRQAGRQGRQTRQAGRQI